MERGSFIDRQLSERNSLPFSSRSTRCAPTLAVKTNGLAVNQIFSHSVKHTVFFAFSERCAFVRLIE